MASRYSDCNGLTMLLGFHRECCECSIYARSPSALQCCSYKEEVNIHSHFPSHQQHHPPHQHFHSHPKRLACSPYFSSLLFFLCTLHHHILPPCTIFHLITISKSRFLSTTITIMKFSSSLALLVSSLFLAQAAPLPLDNGDIAVRSVSM